MLERVHAFARSRRDQDEKFTPYPATWFNAGSYDEESLAKSVKKIRSSDEWEAALLPQDWGDFLDEWFAERPNAHPVSSAEIRAFTERSALDASRFSYLLTDYDNWCLNREANIRKARKKNCLQ